MKKSKNLTQMLLNFLLAVSTRFGPCSMTTKIVFVLKNSCLFIMRESLINEALIDLLVDSGSTFTKMMELSGLKKERKEVKNRVAYFRIQKI